MNLIRKKKEKEVRMLIIKAGDRQSRESFYILELEGHYILHTVLQNRCPLIIEYCSDLTEKEKREVKEKEYTGERERRQEG